MKPLYLIFFIALLSFNSCKKDHIQTEEKVQNGITPPIIPLPDSTMFVGTLTRDSSIIYLLNASTGNLVNKYGYPQNNLNNWLVPLAGNGLLYAAEINKINALNINTGAILWTDSLKSYSSYRPILHNDTFYGVYASDQNTGYAVYALDATKKSSGFLWQYSLGNTPSVFFDDAYINYYNGIIYISATNSLTALDAKTGTLKFTINSPYSLSSLNNGIILSGNIIIDANTGIQTGSIPPSLLVSNTTQYASFLYATKSLFFTRVVNSSIGAYNTYSSTSRLNAYNAISGSLSWSVNGGNNNFNSDTASTVVQIWNNQAIIKTTMAVSAGIYGSVYSINYSGADINTGQLKWTYVAGYKGQSFTVSNMQYSNAALTLNPALGQPAATTIVAADLNTGKVKWSNNKLYIINNGTNALCLFTGSKGYSSYIQ